MKKILSTRVLVKICVLTTILLVLIIYTIWGNSALMVSMVNISSDRIASAFSNFRIAQVSDLHNAEFGESNTNKQNTKRQSTNLSGQTAETEDFDQMEAQVREEFRERLEIDTLAQRYDPDKLEELLDNIVEMYCCPRQTQYVGKQPQTTKAIRLRLDKLTSQHVEYIFDVMSNTTQPIKNIMAYLRTTILNAPTTMEHYYQAQGNWLTAQSRKK